MPPPSQVSRENTLSFETLSRMSAKNGIHAHVEREVRGQEQEDGMMMSYV